MSEEKIKSEDEFIRFLTHLKSNAPVELLQELTTSSFRVHSILKDLKKYGTNIELKLIQADCEVK